MRTRLLTGLAVLLLSATALASLTSSFDTGDEAWTIVGFDPYHHIAPPVGLPVTYAPSFGNPGGSIEAMDVFWGTAVAAPAGFLGDQSSNYGGSISFDIYLRYVSPGSANSAVTLVGASHTLFFVDVPDPSTNTWVSRSYTLLPAGWSLDSINGPPATQMDLLEALSDLRGLWITTEWASGPDDTNIDNVVLAPAPHGSVAIFGSGINPAGSLSVVSGTPQLGATLTFGIDDPTGSMPAITSLPFLYLARAPMPTFPAGAVLPGFGMTSLGASGELLVDPSPQVGLGTPLVGPTWLGAGQPAPISIPIPSSPSLVGLSVYAQGALFDVSSKPWLGLTEAAMVVLGA